MTWPDRHLTTFYYWGRRYALTTPRVDSNQHGVSLWESERILHAVLREPEGMELRRAYGSLSDAGDLTRTTNDVVLSELLRRLRDGERGVSGLLLIELPMDGEVSNQASTVSSDSIEAQRIDRLIGTLSRGDVMHRGHLYRLARAAVMKWEAERTAYEVLGERESRQLLKEMADEAIRPAPQKALLKELFDLSDTQRVRRNDVALLLLRRHRFYERPTESAPITPSQMRKALQGHFIQFDLIDDADIPLAGLEFVLTAPTGTKSTQRFNAEGTYREERTPEGNYELVLARADMHPIEEDHFLDVEVVDQSGMPVAGVQYQILVGGKEVRAGAVGSDGRAHVASLPPGPYDIVLPEFEPEAVMFNGAAAGEAKSASRAAKTHIVQRGETLSKIARTSGLRSWKALYDAPENAELRKKRPNPDTIRVGDEVKVPGGKAAQGSAESGGILRARADRPTQGRRVQLRLVGPDEKALRGAQYFVSGEGFSAQGTLGANGELDVFLPEGAESATLTVCGDDFTVEHDVVFADDGDEQAANQVRLANLGWYEGPVDGSESPAFASAVAYYRGERKLGAGSASDSDFNDRINSEYA